MRFFPPTFKIRRGIGAPFSFLRPPPRIASWEGGGACAPPPPATLPARHCFYWNRLLKMFVSLTTTAKFLATGLWGESKCPLKSILWRQILLFLCSGIMNYRLEKRLLSIGNTGMKRNFDTS